MSDTLTDSARQHRRGLEGLSGSDPSCARVGVEPLDRTVSIKHLVVVGLLAFMVGVVVFRPWPLDEPAIYRADVFQHLAIVQATDDLGGATTSAGLGAPGEVDWSAFPTGTERLQLLVLRAIDAVTGDVFATLNLYLLAGLAATAMVTFAVFRWIRIAPVIAGAAAMVVAVSPMWSEAVFAGHLFLFATYPVALGIYLVLWALDCDGRAPWPSRGSLAIAAAAAVVVGLSNAYYMTFALILISCLGALTALRQRDLRRLLVPLAVVGAIGVTAAVSVAPQMLDRRDQPTSTAVERTVADAREYAIRPASLLVLRSDHPLRPLAALGEIVSPGTSSARVASFFGTAALVGLIWTVLVAGRRWRRPRDTTDATVVRLAAIIVVGLSFAISGGLGLVVAELGFTQIRAWTRMGTFVYVASIAGLALLGQRVMRRMNLPDRTVVRVVVVLAALAVLDQGLVAPPKALAEQAAHSDVAVVRDIRQHLGARAAVFELPVVSFPDDPGSGRLVAPSLVGSDLRFSAGFFRGGDDDWELSWCRQPTLQLVRAVASVGFDALMVQRDHHLLTEAESLQTELTDLLGAPGGVTDDGTWVWWDLRPLRNGLVAAHGRDAVGTAGRIVARPIGVSYSGTVLYSTAGRAFEGEGSIVLRRLDQDRGPLVVQVHVAATPGAVVRVDRTPVTLDAAGNGVARLELTPDDERTRIPVTVEGGRHVTVSDLSVLDERAFNDPVLVADPTFRPASLGCL